MILEDIIGGKIVMANRTLSEASVYSPQITDDVNNLDAPSSSNYYFPIEYEFLSGDLSDQYDTSVDDSAFASRYISSDKLKVADSFTLKIKSDYYGLQTSELVVDGTITVGVAVDGATGVGRGFSGGYNNSGSNNMLDTWDYMPRGGNGGRSYYSATTYSGGVGFSGGGRETVGGAGGGLLFIVADSISGQGTLQAHGSSHTGGNNAGGGGGGGIILILTKEWSGTVALSVNGGGGGTAPAAAGQLGSYAILKINANGSLTLMVHSQNGVSADLNGQTPINGADASIAW